MEIVGIDGLAYEPDRLNQFVGSRHFGIGCIALKVLILLIAIRSVFFAFYRRQKQIVGRGGLPFFDLPRVIRAVAVVFWHRCGFDLPAFPRKSAGCGCAIVGQSVEAASGRTTGADPIAGDGIVNAPLVYDVAVRLYLPLYGQTGARGDRTYAGHEREIAVDP